MKRFAWVQVAVQALAIDGKDGHDEHKRAKKRNNVYIKEVEPLPTPIWAEHARIKSEADLANTAVVEALFNSPSREPPAIPRMVTSDELEERATIRSVTNPYAQRRRSTTAIRPTEKEEEASMGDDYNPAVVQYVSDGYFQDSRSLKRRNENTSTIFQNSLLAPITIIVTTPEENEPPPSPIPGPRNSFNSIRASRISSPNASTTSLPATRFSRQFSTDSLPLPQPERLDPNRLMPPAEYQLDTRRLRKAQEFREIRKFLIHFMNAKGDQFPKKLRSRMMELYAITDADLAPEVLARFNDPGNGDIKDEGVALEQLGMNELEKETTDAEDLRILSMAFQSQIPVMTPSRKPASLGGIPPYLPKNPVRVRGTSINKPPSPPSKSPRPPPPSRIATAPATRAPPQTKQQKRVSMVPPQKERRENEKEKEDDPLTWLGPLISTSPSASTDWPLPLDSSTSSRLQKAQSQPNMFRNSYSPNDAPPLPISGRGRGRGDSLAGRGEGRGVDKALHVARVKRQGIIAGAFGAVKEAMGGRSKK
ncbi:hypothetical protein L207DRAFT_524311 [Hyaloscypha variabilis F]|uniref:Uncharacterized protein n=1 Tax=Hyaloscypha variabilis (strain UAMH 11265 / GT02V1 / F) TaxID=1149755 RepID=A0A2J6S269_HYAVF|nr:hypothetical protein L207DRAFT_524311 [Hyaloscypha variabilis F]